MATLLRMPEIAANVTYGTIAAWAKQPGDAVAVGDCLVEIESDKAVVELNADTAGVMGRLLVRPGQQVDVGTPIGVLLAPGEADVEGDLAVPAVVEIEARVPKPAAIAAQAGGRILASPLARNLAKRHGLDLETVGGTGPGGRIVKRDLDGINPPPQTLSATEIPHTSMRKAIARRLSASKATIPHFYLSADCRMERLTQLRAELNEAASRKISITDFVVRAMALALKEVPDANVGWTDTALRRYKHADIAVAVAADRGLMTPIVREADHKSLWTISAEVADLAARARAGQLRVEEYEGGSFTVSNLGMYGVSSFSAIINPPQAGILAVGSVQLQPVVEDEALVVGRVMKVTLSIDHRAVDGAVAASCLNSFKRFIERPGLLLGT